MQLKQALILDYISFLFVPEASDLTNEDVFMCVCVCVSMSHEIRCCIVVVVIVFAQCVYSLCL